MFSLVMDVFEGFEWHDRGTGKKIAFICGQWRNSFCCNSNNILSLYVLASCAEKQCADGSTCQVGISTVFVQLLYYEKFTC